MQQQEGWKDMDIKDIDAETELLPDLDQQSMNFRKGHITIFNKWTGGWNNNYNNNKRSPPPLYYFIYYMIFFLLYISYLLIIFQLFYYFS